MKLICFALLLLFSFSSISFAQKPVDKEKDVMRKAVIKADEESITITISKVNVTHFPEIKVYFEAYKQNGEPIDSLKADDLMIYEEGKPKKVINVEKISTRENAVLDFVFIIDKTATMQLAMNQVKENITKFTETLKKANIDYRIGGIFFSDYVESIFQPTPNVNEFLAWLEPVKAELGGDTKENALEAIATGVKKISYREEASKICLIVTDAPYHQVYENGDGSTSYNTETITKLLQNNEVRLFSIVPDKLSQYRDISFATRGSTYDIRSSFSETIGFFTGQISNIFVMTYRTDLSAIPDSVEISIYEPEQKRWVKKNVSISGLGRKLIIENLLFSTGSASLPDSVKELDLICEFMYAKPNLALIVEGHTDNVGSDAINTNLSLLRAEAVKRYIVTKGVSVNRIKTKGLGKRKPISTNTTEEGRKLNRRTELVIVSE